MTPTLDALGRVVCRGLRDDAVMVCVGGGGMREEGSSRIDGIFVICLLIGVVKREQEREDEGECGW